MRKVLITAGAALLANTILTAPAMAAKPPLNDTTGLTPQQVCDAQLTPDEHADFLTYPINSVEGSWVTISTEQGDPVGDPYGVGTPTAYGITYNGTYYRNGGSPNVWGGGTANSLVYPQTGQMYETTLHQSRTTTFDCYVYKIVGHNDTLVDPIGLQSTGNSAVETQDIDGPDTEYVTNDPFTADGGTSIISLICISPNKTGGKPGAWVGMHGFTGSCTEASNLAGGTIPSGNAPTTDSGITYNTHN